MIQQPLYKVTQSKWWVMLLNGKLSQLFYIFEIFPIKMLETVNATVSRDGTQQEVFCHHGLMPPWEKLWESVHSLLLFCHTRRPPLLCRTKYSRYCSRSRLQAKKACKTLVLNLPTCRTVRINF